MKVNRPTVIALVLGFLGFAAHAFAGFRSPYPTNAERPDPVVIISSGIGKVFDAY